MPAGEFERSVRSPLRVRCAGNCEENLTVGSVDNNEKDGENDECADPDDEFEGLPLVDDGTTGKICIPIRQHEKFISEVCQISCVV